jgi:hypothetical protein
MSAPAPGAPAIDDRGQLAHHVGVGVVHRHQPLTGRSVGADGVDATFARPRFLVTYQTRISRIATYYRRNGLIISIFDNVSCSP